MKLSFGLLGGFIAVAVAAPLGEHVIHERRDTAHPRWVKREPLEADASIPVRIALKQRNLDQGMNLLLDVSDPRSKNYGRHYSQDDVIREFAPNDESVSSVKRWLIDSGIPEHSIRVPRSKGWVHFDARASQLETILHAEYHVYEHVEARGEHIGTDEYHLPRDISLLVDFITPGVVFASRRSADAAKRGVEKAISPKTKAIPEELAAKLREAPDVTSNCDQAITPACIRAMYNISKPTLAASSNNMGIFENGDVYVQSDLNKFFDTFAKNIPSGTRPSLNSINGAQGTGSVGEAEGEADLDFQVAFPLVYPQAIQLFQVSTEGDDIFNTFLDAIDGSYCTFSADGETGDDPTIDGKTENEQCGAYKPTNVISVSYGAAEADYPTYYLERQCTEFMKLGLQGTTLVFASGDDGVARRSGPCLGPNENIFTPDTPANCPYVTAVGATVLPPGSQPGDAETATVSFSSGGGFSNIFTTPSYQAQSISSYFAKHSPKYPSYNTTNGTLPTTGGIFNRAGRGYPDMAAVGDNGVFFVNGEQTLSGGTSMAAPVVASIFNRINEERINAGKSVIGFVNPTLYQHPEMFNDITIGNQDKGGPNGDGEPSACGNKGFSAVDGWDPVTGLGTPRYHAMLRVFMRLK